MKTRVVNEKELPVLLPETIHYEPSEKGDPPLARQTHFINYKDPVTGEAGKREDSTMPGYAASSWYFFALYRCQKHESPF